MPTINNPSFTSGLTNWTQVGGVTAVGLGDGTVAHTSPNSAFFNHPSGNLAYIFQNIIGHIPTQDYVLTFYANACTGASTFNITLGSSGGTQATVISTATSDPSNSSITFTPGTNSATITLNPTGTTSGSYVLFTIVYTANVANILLFLYYQGISATNTLMVDDFAITDAPVCYRGTSTTLVKHIGTGIISNMKIISINPKIYLVYDVNKKDFVPIIKITKNGNTRRYIKINKDSIQHGVPSEDFFITSGHVVIIDGVEMKARKVSGANRISVKPEYSYSICTEQRTTILVNNMEVIADSYTNWLAYIVNKAMSKICV